MFFFFIFSDPNPRHLCCSCPLSVEHFARYMSLLHTEEGRPAVYSAFHLTALIPYSLFLFPTKIDVPVGSERCLPAAQRWDLESNSWISSVLCPLDYHRASVAMPPRCLINACKLDLYEIKIWGFSAHDNCTWICSSGITSDTCIRYLI